jgi:hypothetical protein
MQPLSLLPTFQAIKDHKLAPTTTALLLLQQFLTLYEPQTSGTMPHSRVKRGISVEV